MMIVRERLFTNRLELRKVEENDLPLLVDWSQSKESYGDYLTPENLGMETLHQQYKKGVLWNDNEKLFLIKKRDSDPIGTIHCWRPVGKKDTKVVALKIAKPIERGKGYGTEAQKYLIIHLFNDQELQQVEMYTDINNVAEQRCLQKLGFELVESLTYDDQKQSRMGNLYRLTRERFSSFPVYSFHYE